MTVSNMKSADEKVIFLCFFFSMLLRGRFDFFNAVLYFYVGILLDEFRDVLQCDLDITQCQVCNCMSKSGDKFRFTRCLTKTDTSICAARPCPTLCLQLEWFSLCPLWHELDFPGTFSDSAVVFPLWILFLGTLQFVRHIPYWCIVRDELWTASGWCEKKTWGSGPAAKVEVAVRASQSVKPLSSP